MQPASLSGGVVPPDGLSNALRGAALIAKPAWVMPGRAFCLGKQCCGSSDGLRPAMVDTWIGRSRRQADGS
jgi:hypothetical protein